jgi:hypothetical protein
MGLQDWNGLAASMMLDIACTDFLAGNQHIYAKNARRKEIAIIRVEANNRQTSPARLNLGAAQLFGGGRNWTVENPTILIRKLSEFTWDFLLYSILDFHPITAALETLVFLTGPLYNRRLRRQLRLLSNADLMLGAGETKVALLGFRAVSQIPDRLTMPVFSDNVEQQLECCFRSA